MSWAEADPASLPHRLADNDLMLVHTGLEDDELETVVVFRSATVDRIGLVPDGDTMLYRVAHTPVIIAVEEHGGGEVTVRVFISDGGR